MRKHWFSVLLVVAALLGSTLAAAQVDTLAQSPTNTTDSAAGANEAANESAWRDAQIALRRELRNSPRPRDWVLLAWSIDPLQTERSAQQDDDLRQRAAKAAPNDALVQWLAALHSVNAVDPSRARSAIARLAQLENDNAAAWMLALTVAARQKDARGIDDALHRMASSQRYDEHYADTMHAWMDVFDRYPPPVPQDRDLQFSPALASFTVAMAIAAATAMPAYQDASSACKPGDAQTISAQRRADCTSIAHLLLHRGLTLAARSFGAALLRRLGDGLPTSADEEARRQLDWYMYCAVQTSGVSQGNLALMTAYQADWRALDDEIEVIRRALRRQGLPTEPPVDWVMPSRIEVTKAASPKS